MAKIQTQSIVITLNKLVKDCESDSEILVTNDLLTALEQVAQELAGVGVVVETQLA
jgi:hypothetical protein